jgi:redox-sensing transcriptional repressor
MLKSELPRKAVYRLSIYQRCLSLLQDNGVERVSSEDLSKAAGVKPAQLRKDLSYCGPLGTRGLGYPVESLRITIEKVLGSHRLQPVILVGAGNLGSALLRYQGFRKEGFEILAAFDQNPGKIKTPIEHTPVYDVVDMPAFITENKVKMAILCVPVANAQDAANQLVQNGIQGILNFTPAVLHVPEGVVVNSVDLALELESLSYYIR